MSDPWIDVRYRMRLTRDFKARDKYGWMQDIQDLGQLLVDADALLVLRGTLLRMSHMVDSGGKWEAVDAAVMHEMAEKALAALPEHLRES